MDIRRSPPHVHRVSESDASRGVLCVRTQTLRDNCHSPVRKLKLRVHAMVATVFSNRTF